MSERIKTHQELIVYQRAFEAAVRIFELSRLFPVEERYSLTDQVRRSSRSVCANIAEAWRKRRYEKSFISKLSDAEAEAGETQVWIAFALRFEYINPKEANQLHSSYDDVLRTLVGMINHPETWIITDNKRIREDGIAYNEPSE
jgi:four helix bundle protein